MVCHISLKRVAKNYDVSIRLLQAVFPKYIKILRKFSKGLVPKIKFCLFFNIVGFWMRNWKSLILKKFIYVLNFG